MASKFEFLLGLVVCAHKVRATRSWTDDFTECNMYRLIEQECPKDSKGSKVRQIMIPATQRTNNVAGYALDITPWTAD